MKKFFKQRVIVLIANCNIASIVKVKKQHKLLALVLAQVSVHSPALTSKYLVYRFLMSRPAECLLLFLYHLVMRDMTVMYHLQKTDRHLSDSCSKTRLAKRQGVYSKPMIFNFHSHFSVVKFLQRQRWTIT